MQGMERRKSDFYSHKQPPTFQFSFQLRSLIFHYSSTHANLCKYADIACQGAKTTLPSLPLWFLRSQLLRCPLLSLHTLLQRLRFPAGGTESDFPEGRQEDFQSPLGSEEYQKITIFLISQNTDGLQVGVGVSVRKIMRKTAHGFATLRCILCDEVMWDFVFQFLPYFTIQNIPSLKTQTDHVTLLIGTFIFIET